MTLRSTFVNLIPTRFKTKIFDEPNKEKKEPPMERLQSTDTQSLAGVLGGADENPDEILKKQGIAVYDEMEAKDTHVYSVYQTRKLAVSMIPWDIYPGDDSDRQKEIRDFIFTAIDDCKGVFSEDLKQLLDAIGKGFSILEIVWKLIDTGRWKGKYTVDELIFHKQKYWYFEHMRWHKTDGDIVLFGSGIGGKPVPWEKIIYYAYDSEDNLYGRAAFKPCYYFYWFKKEGWKSWVVFLNKYGSPTAVGKYPKGTKDTDQTKLLDIVQRIQEETGIIYPDGMDISFLEATHQGTVSYEALANACNAEISKAILGATQTVEEGRRGSYALSRAHSEVRRERVEADAVEISDVINQQLVKRLVDFNFDTDVYPQFIMKLFVGKNTPIAQTKPVEVSKKPEEEVVVEETPDELPVKEIPEEKEVSETIKPESTVLKVESPTVVTPEGELDIKLENAFDRIKGTVKKNFAKRNVATPINVGPLRKVLQEEENFDEEDAFNLAKKIKEFIELNAHSSMQNPENTNVDQVFNEALGLLHKELSA